MNELLPCPFCGSPAESGCGFSREAIRVAPDRTEDIEHLADEIAKARDDYLNAFHLGHHQRQPKLDILLKLFCDNKGGFAPLLRELADRRRLSSPIAQNGEAVAWRWRNKAWEADYWAFTSQQPQACDPDIVVEPLYAAPQPSPVEMNKARQDALDLAVNIIMAGEPGDSRAVSDEAVALAAVACGDTSEPVMAVIRAALARSPAVKGDTHG